MNACLTMTLVLALAAGGCGGGRSSTSSSSPSSPSAAPRAGKAVNVDRTKDAQAVAARFGFPAVAIPAAGAATVAVAAPPVYLVATHVSPDLELSFATVINHTTGGGGYYGIGDDIPAAGRVTAIAPRRLAYRDATGAERALVLELAPPAAPAAAKASATTDRQAVTRTELETLLTDPSGAGARLAAGQGRVKLYAVRTGGLVDRLGFKNGDVILDVAGVAVTSADAALAATQRLRAAVAGDGRIDVNLERGGERVTLSLAIASDGQDGR